MTEIYIALLSFSVYVAFCCGRVWEKHKQDNEIEALKARLRQLEELTDKDWKEQKGKGVLRPKNLRAC